MELARGVHTHDHRSLFQIPIRVPLSSSNLTDPKRANDDGEEPMVLATHINTPDRENARTIRNEISF
jgi:hypothetical protein